MVQMIAQIGAVPSTRQPPVEKELGVEILELIMIFREQTQASSELFESIPILFCTPLVAKCRGLLECNVNLLRQCFQHRE